MRLPFAAVLVLGLSAPILADDKNEADLKAMVGNWTVQKAERGGKDLTEQFKTLKFEVRAGGKYTTRMGQITDDGAFTVDAAKTPKEVDIKGGGPNKGKTKKAIYKQDGDTLTVCYEFTVDTGKRPEKFESKADTTVMLITYTREKK